MLLEQVCREQALVFHSNKGGVTTLVAGQKPECSHWIQVWYRKDGLLGISVPFRRTSGHPIDKVDEFCAALSDGFSSDARLMYDTRERRFSAWSVIAPSRLASSLVYVARDCDIAKPICARVSSLGRWEPQFLSHLFAPTNQLLN